MAIKQSVDIDTNYIKSYLKETNQSAKTISVKMGNSANYISSSMQHGCMSLPNIKLMCLLSGMEEDKVVKSHGVVQERTDTTKALYEATEIVVSYVQDLGKIQSDILRTLKEDIEALNETQKEILKNLNEFKEMKQNYDQQLVSYFKYGRK